MNASVAAYRNEEEAFAASRALGVFGPQPTGNLLGRTAVALSRAIVNGRSNPMTLRNDEQTRGDLVLRAAVGIIDTSAVADLVGEQIAATIKALASRVVLSELDATDVALPAGAAQCLHPRLALAPTAAAAWVVEGGAIPVAAGVSDAITFGPLGKLGVLVGVTEELFARSDAAAAIEAMLLQACAKAINVASMSNAPAAGATPAGLFSDAWASAAIPSSSLANDLNALAAALSENFAMSAASYIMHPGNLNKAIQSPAFAAALASSGTINGARVIASPAVPLTRIALVADSVVLRALDLDPGSVSLSNDATIHAESAPSIDLGGATAPVFSAFQSRGIWVRCVAFANWGSTHREGIQHVEDASWS